MRWWTQLRNTFSKPMPTGSVASTALVGMMKPEAHDVPALAREMRNDYQVRLAELVLAANVRAAPTRIIVTGAAGFGDTRATQLAARLHQLWRDSLPAMLGALGDGRVAFEKIWEFDPALQLTTVRKLEPLPAEQTKLKLHAGGAFAGIELRTTERSAARATSSGEPTVRSGWRDEGSVRLLSTEKTWWLAIDATPLEPHGRSRFLGAPYTVWKEHSEAIRLRKMFLKRFVVRGGVAHVPPTAINLQGEVVDNFEATAQTIDERVSGGTVLFPNTRDSRGNYEFEYTEPPQTLDPAPIDNIIDGLDAELLRAFGIPEKTVIEGQAVGSYALASQQMLILYAVVEDLLTQFAQSFQRYVIDKVVAANYESFTAPKLLLHVPSLGDSPTANLVELTKALLTATPTPTTELVDMKQLLQAAGVPVKHQELSPGQ